MKTITKNNKLWMSLLLFIVLISQFLTVDSSKAKCNYYNLGCKEYTQRTSTRIEVSSKSNYKYNLEYYHIEGEPSYSFHNKVLRLKWESFRLSGDMPYCYKDKVTVLTGCSDSKTVGTFCGNDGKPHDIYTHSKCVTLKVINGNKYGSYFRVVAEFIDKSAVPISDCSLYERMLSEPRGVIIAPGWPQSAPNTMNCKWRIRTQSDKSITLNIMDFKSSYVPNCQSYLQLSGVQSHPYSKFNKKLCDSLLSSIHTTYNYDVKIEYYFKKVYWTSASRGFALGWVTYDNPKQNDYYNTPTASTRGPVNSKKSKSSYRFNTIGVVTSVFVFIVVISISCARIRHRRALLTRQRTNQHCVISRLNRERAVASSSAGGHVEGVGGSQTGNGSTGSNEIGKINNGLQTTPYYLPPPKYTATDNTGPPPSYSDIMLNQPPVADNQPPTPYPMQTYTEQTAPYPPPSIQPYPPPGPNQPPVNPVGLQPYTIPFHTATNTHTSGPVQMVAPYPTQTANQQATNTGNAPA